MLAGELVFVLEAKRPAGDNVNKFPWASEEIVLAVPAHFKINESLKKYGYTSNQFLEQCQSRKRYSFSGISVFRKSKNG